MIEKYRKNYKAISDLEAKQEEILNSFTYHFVLETKFDPDDDEEQELASIETTDTNYNLHFIAKLEDLYDWGLLCHVYTEKPAEVFKTCFEMGFIITAIYVKGNEVNIHMDADDKYFKEKLEASFEYTFTVLKKLWKENAIEEGEFDSLCSVLTTDYKLANMLIKSYL